MTGIVLIGGKSQRFGSDKVVTPVGEKLLVEHVIDVIAPLFDEILLVGHPREPLSGHRIVEDLIPGSGPLGGIFTALTHARGPQCFLFAADMPNLNQAFISYMIRRAEDYDIVVPMWSKGREPLHAIYHSRLTGRIERLLKSGERKIYPLLKEAHTLVLDEEIIRTFGRPEEMFANINTQHDLPVSAPR
ncbi:MAG: molybdenum cofactor guanylyltransferase [Desulfomonilia bacterium]|nr:molybdenum cofactor guanylyltransferase [Desulfomonilia bacterium]